MDNLKTWSAFT